MGHIGIFFGVAFGFTATVTLIGQGGGIRFTSQMGALGGTNHDEVVLQDGLNWAATNHGILWIDQDALVGTNLVGFTNPVSGTIQYSALQIDSAATVIATGSSIRLADHVNVGLLQNRFRSDPSVEKEHDITIIGGTWDGNGDNQSFMDLGGDRNQRWSTNNMWTMAVGFGGVSNLVLQGLTCLDSKSMGLVLANAIDVRTEHLRIGARVRGSGGQNHDGFHLWSPVKNLFADDTETFNLDDNPVVLAAGEIEYLSGWFTNAWGRERFSKNTSWYGFKNLVFHHTYLDSLLGIGLWSYPAYATTTFADVSFIDTTGYVYSGGMMGTGINLVGPLRIEGWSVDGGGSRICVFSDPNAGGTISISGATFDVAPYNPLADAALEPLITAVANEVNISDVLVQSTNLAPYLIRSSFTNGFHEGWIIPKIKYPATNTTRRLTITGVTTTGIDYLVGNTPGLTNLTVSAINGPQLLTNSWASTYGGDARYRLLAQSTKFARMGVQANQFSFDIAGLGNSVVVVEACENLASPNWSPVATNTLAEGLTCFNDPAWRNLPTRFYRLRFQ